MGGTLQNVGLILAVRGDWINNGGYSEARRLINNRYYYPIVGFIGAQQTIGGDNASEFSDLRILSGSTVTQEANVTIDRVVSNRATNVQVDGTLNAGAKKMTLVYDDAFTVGANGVLQVMALNFSSNYSRFPTQNKGATIEYAANGPQNIVTNTHDNLLLSGSGVKSLTGHTTNYADYVGGNVTVKSGVTLNLGTYTLLRSNGSTAGGELRVEGGGRLHIGNSDNADNFPAGSPGYQRITLDANSTVEYNGSGDQTISTQTYGNLILTGSGTKRMPATTLTVAGNFEGNGSAVFTARGAIDIAKDVLLESDAVFSGTTSGGTFTHKVGGNWTNNATFNSVNSTVRMTGSGKVIAGSSAVNEFNNLSIEGNTNILANNLYIRGNLSTLGGNTLSQNNNGKVTMTGTSKSITVGTVDAIQFQNLEIDGSVTTASSFIVHKDLIVNSSRSFSATAGRITFSDVIDTILDDDIINSGTLSINEVRFTGRIGSRSSFSIKSDVTGAGKFTGKAGTVTFAGSSTFNGTHDFYNITIDGTNLKMAGSANLGAAGNFAIDSGIFDAVSNTPNTVTYNGSVAQSVLPAVYNHIIFDQAGSKTAAGAITVNGNLSINGSATFNASTYRHNLHGNFTNSGTFNHDNGNIAMVGGSNSTITGAAVFNELTVDKASNGVFVNLANDATTTLLNMTSGMLRTGSFKINVLSNRTGNGWVLGTIRRSHAFAANTAYAFNAPHAQISFETVTNVDEISVRTTAATISNFPAGAAINRSYEVIIPDGSYTGASLKLQYEDSELNGNPENSSLQLYKNMAGTWTAVGANDFSATDNWVRKDNVQDPATVPNVTGTWTLSATTSVYQWVGAISDRWEIVGNWENITTGSGVPATTYPGSSDIVELGGYNFNHNPTIRAAETVKGMRFWGAKVTTLTLGTGGSLSVTGNLAAAGTGGLIHTIDAGANNLTVGGDLILHSGAGGNNLNISSSSGVVAVAGSLDHGVTSTITLGTGKFKLGGDFLNANYTRFNRGTSSEFIYEGSNSQIIGEVLYHHLTVNKSGGVATLTAAQTGGIYGNLTISGGTLSVPGGNYIMNGSINHSGGTFSVGSSTITANSTWVKSVSAIFDAGTSNIIFAGAGAQAIPSATFNILTINRPDTTTAITLAGNVLVNSELDVQSGRLRLNSRTLRRTAQGGTFNLRGSSILELNGSNYPANFNNNILADGSTVRYRGTATQNIAAVTYGNLVLQNTGAKTLTASTQVNGDLTINSGTTLNANEQELTLSGNFANGGIFNPGYYNTDGSEAPNGRLVLASTGGAQRTISGNHLFINNLLVQKLAHYKFETDITIQGEVDIVGEGNVATAGMDLVNNGYLNAGVAKVSVAGDFKNQGILRSSGEAKFLGTRHQNIQLLAPILPGDTGSPTVEFAGEVPPTLNSSADPTFASVTISNIGGVTTSRDWTILGSFVVKPGAKFHGIGRTHTFATAFTNHGEVTSSGILNFEPQSLGQKDKDGNPLQIFPFNMGVDSTSLKSTGTIIFGGGLPITLAGAVPAKLNNLTIANTHSFGVRTFLYGASPTPLSAQIPAINGTKWKIEGDFRVEPGASFTAGSDTKYLIGGNFTNNGVINASGADFGLLSLRKESEESGGAIIPSTVNGTGLYTLRNLTVVAGAKASLESNITLTGNFNHLGAELKAANIELNFTGASEATINATNGPVGLAHLKVTKTGTGKLSMGVDVNELLDVKVESGELDLISFKLTGSESAVDGGTEPELTVDDNAVLKVGGIGTASQLQMDKYSFAANSTVEYYGGSSVTEKQVVLSEQYGNLILSNPGTKEFAAGHAKIAGDFDVSDGTAVITPSIIEYNGTAIQAVAAINYNNLAISTSGSKVLAAGTTGIAGAFTRADAATADATTNATTVNYNGAGSQDILPISYHTLNLSNGGTKSFSGTTGVAKDFAISGAIADLVTATPTINFNGSTAQKIAGANYYNVSIAGGGSKELTDDALIANRLDFVSGNIDTKENKITLANTGSFINESAASYLTGAVETTRDVTAQESFGGMGMTVTPTVGTPGEVKVTRVTGAGAALGNGDNVKRYFLLEPTTPNTNNRVDVAMSYFDHELEPEMVNKDEELVFYWSKSSPTTSYWKSIVPSATPTGKQVNGTNLGPAGYFTLGRTVTPLPIELISFKASKNGSNAVLNWETAMEQNNEGFEVEVSTDGYTYRKIGFVKSKVINTYSKQSYTFTDTEKGKAGVRYYRLKQLDENGEHTYYGPRAVTFSGSQAVVTMAYPNPFKSTLQVSFAAENAGTARVILYSASGKVQHEETLAVTAGVNEQQLQANLEHLSRGLYLLIVEVDGEKKSIKLIKE
ncbi:T9SS type A sorting domain-containing protein [Pontibacter sp. H249]|uniref:T9SS type A sorting domain-containing protein n=1 Tax=Pontibacter sp. H249 TaxID=3133420 RepID=UPI0030C2DA05